MYLPIVLISRYLFYATLVVITYLALAPQDAVIVTTGWDKTNHLLAFAVLLALFDYAHPSRSIWTVKLPLLIIYAALIEIIQIAVPGREASWFDLLADGLGLLSYMVIRPVVEKVISAIFVDNAS